MIARACMTDFRIRARNVAGLALLLLGACENLSGISNNIMPGPPPQYASLAEPPEFFTEPEQWQPGLHARYSYRMEEPQTLDQMITPERPVEVAELPRVQILPGRSTDFDVPVAVARADAHQRTLAVIRGEMASDRRIIVAELSGDEDQSTVLVSRGGQAESTNISAHGHVFEYTSAFYDLPEAALLDLHGVDLFHAGVGQNSASVHRATFFPQLAQVLGAP